MTLRKGCVYFKYDLAGYIEETDTGYNFSYDTNFLDSPSAHPISVTLPL